MMRIIFMATLFFAAATFPQSITLISPNGGETYTSGQPVMIRWTSEHPGVYVWLEYSVDSGKNWGTISTVWETSDSCIWTPMVKSRVDKAILRITADTNVFSLSLRDSSDSSFVILPLQGGDDYEPNDDFSSAYPISTGDSVVKNAFAFGVDSLEPDSSCFDVDYYKIILEAGKLLTISLIPWNRPSFDDDQQLAFALFDSLKSLLYSANSGQKSCGYNVTRAGTYYIEIRNTRYAGWGPPNRYGLSLLQLDNKGLITIISPKGGETFSAEDTVTVQYQADSTLFDRVAIQYSIDSGKSWRNGWCWYSMFTGYSWRVPHLKHRTDRALIRAIPSNSDITNTNPPFGVSNGTFTILASPNDVYEPNDDFVSAKAVEPGDSVVKNAIVMTGFHSSDSGVVDTSLTDNDFFKVSLTAGNVVTISNVCYQGGDEEDMVPIRLYDASKNQIGMGSPSLSCYISQSGVYYCEISPMCEFDYWTKYCLSIRQVVGGAIALISPNGGENFIGGQKALVSWTGDSSLGEFELYYSKDNGTTWQSANSGISYNSAPFSWTIPALKTRTDQALVKVVANNVINKPSDVSDGTFTIQAAPKDAYEPNDDFLSAYSIALGDSAVKNAATYVFDDPVLPDTVEPPDSLVDLDYFKVNLTAGSLVRIRCGDSGEGRAQQSYELFNGFQQLSPIRGYDSWGYYRITSYNIKQSGVYYIKVWPEFGYSGSWFKYGLSIKSIKTLLTQTSIVDSNARIGYDTSKHNYRYQLIADTTNLILNFWLPDGSPGSITTMVLAPENFAPAPQEKAKLKTFAVFYWILRVYAEIAIPYSLSDLNGYPEKALAVARYNDESDLWVPVPSSIDTVKHQIVFVGLPLASAAIYQVYVKSDAGIGPVSEKSGQVFGIRANFLSSKQSIAVHFTLPTLTNADLRLYNVQGKCVRRGTFAVRPGSSTLLWNFGVLSNGKYILTVKAGLYHVQKTLLIIN